ncbi:MAG: dehydrogenase E1 component subunit alpha/beta [Bacteroidota bacterium]
MQPPASEQTPALKKALPTGSTLDDHDLNGRAVLLGFEGDLTVKPVGPHDFSTEQLRAVLRTMLTSRRLDEKMLTLLKQGKGFFHIGASGHEAAQIGLGMHLRGGHDWFAMYYRDLATALSIGVTAQEVMLAHHARATDPFSGGRQMPEHFSHRDLQIFSTSSSVGAQWVPGVGFALASQRQGTDAVTYISGGEGSTSQGSFHEALNWASRAQAPALFHVQDNGYAISVPVHEQTAGGSIYPLLGGYTGLTRARYDGTDFFTTFAVAKAATGHLRAGRGPVALYADVVRLLPHSSSDDHKKYRPLDELEADQQRDPIARFERRVVNAGLITLDDVAELRAEVKQAVEDAARWAESQPLAEPSTATQFVVSEADLGLDYESSDPDGELIVMVDAINHALDEEMARDERVLVYGEDVAGGKGGVFTATRGLTSKHGADRCFNSPLAEHSIVGSAVGLSCAGFKPVVEIQFGDYIWPAMQQLRNQVAPLRYRSNNTWACPMVIRVPVGGYIHGGLCHSQNIEAIFGHMPGFQIAFPSNSADAKGLLKTAIRMEDPVLFLEHKALYRQGPARRPEPNADYLVPFGKAAIARAGTDLTIVTWGALVYKALNAAKALQKQDGVSVEVIDLRTILPLDMDTVLASVKKTNRVLVAYEDHEFMGFGAEIAAQIADRSFGHLDAPIRRVAGAWCSIPYADPLEKAVLPQDDDVIAAARNVLAY